MPPLNSWGCVIAVIFWWLWLGWLGLSWGSHILSGFLSLLLEKQLIIGPTRISMDYRFLARFSVFKQIAALSQISMIEIVNDSRQNSAWGEQEIKGEIIIWAGNYAFRINKLGGLTTPEIAWLSGELEDWLGLQPYIRQIDEVDTVR